jgi:hypothetical protein
LPTLPERTRLFRVFTAHRAEAFNFLARPTLLGIVDSFGVEWIYPVRQGRSLRQIGLKGLSYHRWIVGGKLCLMAHHPGGVTGWVRAPAQAHETWFHPLIDVLQQDMVVFGDSGFHAETGDPPNLKVCQPDEWNERMLIETVLSMLTLVSHFKEVMRHVAAHFEARLAFTVAASSLLVPSHGWRTDAHGFMPLAIADFGS